MLLGQGYSRQSRRTFNSEFFVLRRVQGEEADRFRPGRLGFATYAYIGDIFIIAPYRGRGLGKWLMDSIMRHPALQGLRRWSLVTRDAHEFYRHVGFTPLKFPKNHMEIHRPDV
jgi:GNAT superfamily N-acetyltransferase